MPTTPNIQSKALHAVHCLASAQRYLVNVAAQPVRARENTFLTEALAQLDEARLSIAEMQAALAEKQE